MSSRSRKIAQPARFLTLTAFAVLAAAPLAPPAASAAHAAPVTNTSVPTVTFMSPDQYSQQWALPPSASVKITKIPDVFRTDSGTIVTAAGSPIALLDPPGGGGTASWQTIEWDEHDLRGVGTPTRLGNSSLGYNHFAKPHNLYTHKPITASFQTHKPDVDSGAHVEYIAWAVNTSDGSIKAQVRVVVQAATRTDDGKWQTNDGKNIGVITAYCQGVTLCPNWINSI
jgi:uncharacterized lipoprotein YbaY